MIKATAAQYESWFVFLHEQHANGDIYVWGGQGQVASEKLINSMETGADRRTALSLLKKRIAKGYKASTIRAVDCSGLGMYYMQNIAKLYDGDKTADGLLADCTQIQKNHLKKGDFVFRTYKVGGRRGHAYHIGYVYDDDLNIIHSKGHAYGVVMEKFNSAYWNTCGRPGVYAPYIDTKEERAEHASFNRELIKGTKGDDVKELQKLLNSVGGAALKVDGDFGALTRIAVRTYQRRKSIAVDGIAGKQTISALGGKWVGK